MDIATVFGVVSALGLVVGAILMGGGHGLFISIPSLLIVVGGTLGAAMINYPLRDVIGVFNTAQKPIFTTNMPVNELIGRFAGYANKSRKECVLALESEIKSVKDLFFKKIVQLSIGGLEPQDINKVLETEIELIRNRQQLGAEIFSTTGVFAPALGMIGTLIGLDENILSHVKIGKEKDKRRSENHLSSRIVYRESDGQGQIWKKVSLNND